MAASVGYEGPVLKVVDRRDCRTNPIPLTNTVNTPTVTPLFGSRLEILLVDPLHEWNDLWVESSPAGESIIHSFQS